MKLRTLFLIICLGLVAGFVALNWNLIAAPTTLSLGFWSIYAPLGLLLLGLTVLLVVPLLAYIGFLQRAALSHAARNAEKLEAQRELAEKAEASRFTELRGYLEDEWGKQAGREEQLRADVMARLNQFESELHAMATQLEVGDHALAGDRDRLTEHEADADAPHRDYVVHHES